MRRFHLFEFEDQVWFPQIFRGFITDLLYYQLTTFDVYQPIIPKLKNVLVENNCYQIIDLCSGSTGPLLDIQRILAQEEDYPTTLTLTDKYPNIEAFQRLIKSSNQPIKFSEISIDATAVPTELKGFRTLFTAFHHFQPEIAQKILQDAVEKNTSIGIFEFTERTLINFLKVILFAPLIVLLQTSLIRPFKLSRLFWTYIIPVVPFTYAWDALVSHIRTYSVGELQAMTANLTKKGYRWETGQIKSPKSAFNLTYLIGYPQK